MFEFRWVYHSTVVGSLERRGAKNGALQRGRKIVRQLTTTSVQTYFSGEFFLFISLYILTSNFFRAQEKIIRKLCDPSLKNKERTRSRLETQRADPHRIFCCRDRSAVNSSNGSPNLNAVIGKLSFFYTFIPANSVLGRQKLPPQHLKQVKALPHSISNRSKLPPQHNKHFSNFQDRIMTLLMCFRFDRVSERILGVCHYTTEAFVHFLDNATEPNAIAIASNIITSPSI